MSSEGFTRRQVALLLVVISGVVGSGAGVWVLTRVGYPRLGTIVFALGYGGVTLLVYYYWIRPLEFAAPRWEDDE
jgi:hypothetical protein